MEKSRVKPCPFCGGVNLGYVYTGQQRIELKCAVMCGDCLICGPGGTDKEDALRKWNTRKGEQRDDE